MHRTQHSKATEAEKGKRVHTRALPLTDDDVGPSFPGFPRLNESTGEGAAPGRVNIARPSYTRF